MKILIIGGGNMGRTYAQNFLRNHIALPQNLMVLCRNEERATQLSAHFDCVVLGAAEACLPAADLIVLAVKPQDAAELFSTIAPFVQPGQVYLSVMAGIRMAGICQALGIEKVVRAMPNLPAKIGAGVTAYTSTEAVTRIELAMVHNLLSTTGKTLYLENEALLDACTAVSGSGPAYVFYFMETMMQAARELGFSDAEAELLVAQTFTGAVDLYNQTNLSCEEWIQRVASRGGTTEAALEVFQQKSLQSGIHAGMRAAHERARQLGAIVDSNLFSKSMFHSTER